MVMTGLWRVPRPESDMPASSAPTVNGAAVGGGHGAMRTVLRRSDGIGSHSATRHWESVMHTWEDCMTRSVAAHLSFADEETLMTGSRAGAMIQGEHC